MKKIFLTGLLVLLPLVVTLWVVSIVARAMDVTLVLLPSRWQPDVLFGFNFPGVGAILTLLIIFLVGLLAHNFLGKKAC